MKRILQCVSLILIFTICLAIPVAATEQVTPWASNYFGYRSAYLWKTSNTQFQVHFDVTAVSGMSELGASIVKIQRSPDNSTWTTVRTYTKEDTPSLIAYNTGNHASHVPTTSSYTGISGYYYRAYVQFYAKNSSGGRGYYDFYTASIYIP